MRMEIKSENYNRFLKRKEFSITIEHPEEATPSAAAVQQLLAKQTSVAVEKTEVKGIVSSNGAALSECTAYVWDEKNVKDLSQKPAEQEKTE